MHYTIGRYIELTLGLRQRSYMQGNAGQQEHIYYAVLEKLSWLHLAMIKSL